jgi:hypothetical protein
MLQLISHYCILFCSALVWAGACLCMPPVMAAAYLCTAVYDGDSLKLRRLLHAGANANAADYDKRTALHIAAADGNLPAVRCHRLQLLGQPPQQTTK